MKTILGLGVSNDVVNGLFLALMADTTHAHVGSVLRYGEPGMQLLMRHSDVRSVVYNGHHLLDLLLPFYLSGLSDLESKWCAPDTVQLTVGGYCQRHALGLFVPQRDVIDGMRSHRKFNAEYAGFGLVVKYKDIAVIVDGSKRACVAGLSDQQFFAIELESYFAPLLWSCEFFQSAVKGLL